MSHAVCKICPGKVKYCGNMMDIQTHVTRHHPEIDMVAEKHKSSVEFMPGQQQMYLY